MFCGVIVESGAGRQHRRLRENGLVVETRPVCREIIHRRRVELVNVVEGVLLDVLRAHVAKPRQRCARERQGLRCDLMLVNPDDAELIRRIQREVYSTDVLVRLGGHNRVEGVAIRSAVGCRDIGLHEVQSNRIERGGRNLARIRSGRKTLGPYRARRAVWNARNGRGNLGVAECQVEMCRVLRDQILREISGEVRRRWNENRSNCLRNDLPRSLIRTEEEQLVLHDRSADRSTEDVLVVLRS